MSLEIACPNGHRLQINPDQVGQTVRCPTCQIAFVVTDPRGVGAPPRPAGMPGIAPAMVHAQAPRNFSLSGLSGMLRTLAQAFLFIGVTLVLLARGCDALGERSVSSKRAKVTYEQQKFDQVTTNKLSYYDDDIASERKKDTPDDKAIRGWQDDRTKYSKDRTDERRKLEQGDWRRLSDDAQNASAENVINSYWRETLFVLGTLLTSLGLLAIGLNGQGAERWVCLTILAIIIFSVYVGGIAWTSSILPNLR